MSDLSYLIAVFVVVMLASEWVGRAAKRVRLPVITGFLLAGMLTGPFVLGLLSSEQVLHLRVVDEIALAFIAFAAGGELHYREIRQQLRRIWWITISIVAASYLLIVPALVWFGEAAPFLEGMDRRGRFAVGLIAGAILVSRSPSSLMALVAELRARGPFTRLLMGVTVALDVVVIMLFAVCTSVAEGLLRHTDIETGLLLLVLGEIVVAVVVGAVVAGLIHLVLLFGRRVPVQAVLILATGLGVYVASGWLRQASLAHGPLEIFLEPLLVCMVAGFVVGNFSSRSSDYQRVIKSTGPLVYLGFFTLAGASLDLAALRIAWKIGLLLLALRIVAIIAGSYVGSLVGGAPPAFRRRVWLGMLTQAGIGLGLAKEIAVDFPAWGGVFATTIIAVIVVNQIVGPPAEKWVLRRAGEARADLGGRVRGAPRALIFGLDGQSWALAQQLADHGWRPALVSRRNPPQGVPGEIELLKIEGISAAELRRIGADKARTLVALMSDEENVELCRLAYEDLGVSNVVARVGSQDAAARCQRFGAAAIDPAVALVNVLDHFVRSPSLTGMVVGMDVGRDVIEVEVDNPDVEGAALRDLQLPLDVLVLSVRRRGASIISHGYTRLQRGDLVTLVGRRSSLERVEDSFAGQVG